ncbi:MAG: hypothetical protein U9R60_11670 [Bacteroidota bacterium]|nr:hypothetical protein [Bacteroidota bacterium]
MISKKIVVQSIIEKVEKEHDDLEIKTSLVEGFSQPDKIINEGKRDTGYTPDVLLRDDNSTDIYEVELDKDFNLDKWRLFSLISNKQKGSFIIVTPEDNIPQVRKALDENQINARIIYFS